MDMLYTYTTHSLFLETNPLPHEPCKPHLLTCCLKTPLYFKSLGCASLLTCTGPQARVGSRGRGRERGSGADREAGLRGMAADEEEEAGVGEGSGHTAKLFHFLIQFIREVGSRSREEKVGDWRPDGLCWRMHESFCTA